MDSHSSRNLQSDGGLQGAAARLLEGEGLREQDEASPTSLRSSNEAQPSRHRRRRRRRRQGAGAAPYRIPVTFARDLCDGSEQIDLLGTLTVFWEDSL
jgi:hypothetical protein